MSLVLFAVATVLPLLRLQGRRSWETLFAEDGFLLYQDATDVGFRALFRSYNGYLILPPRLLSLPTPWVGIEQVPLYFAVASSVVAALLAWFVYHHSRGWIPSPYLRLGLASLLVLMPVAGMEITASTVNTIWVFVAICPWAFVSVAEGRVAVVVRSVVAFLTATATVVSFVFVPLAICWAVYRRTRAAVTVAVSFLVGLAVQAIVMLRAADDIMVFPPTRPFTDLVNLTGVRVFGVYALGPGRAAALWNDHGLIVAVGSAVIVLAVFVLAGWGAEPRHRVLGAVLLAYGVATFVALIWGRGTLPFRGSGSLSIMAQSRYSVPSTMFLASGLAVLLARSAPNERSRRLGRVGFLVQLAVVIVISFSVTTSYRSLGPSWSERLAAARDRCRAASSLHEVKVPQDAFMYWAVRVPCKDLNR